MHVSICTNVNVGTCTFMHNVPAQKSIQTAGKNKASLFTASEILICISFQICVHVHINRNMYTHTYTLYLLMRIHVHAYIC